MKWNRWKILLLALQARPMSVIVPAAFIPIGAVTTVLGTDTSRAFSLLPESAQFIAHAMGMMMFMGGVLVLIGVSNGETFTELIGLVSLALGSTVYGLGVIIGLGVNGLVTGPMFVFIAAAAITRVVVSLRLAAQVRRSRNGVPTNGD